MTAAPVGPNGGSESAHALQRVKQLEDRAADLEAKTLVEIRALRELVLEQLGKYGDQATHLANAVAELAKDVRERMPAKRRRKGA